MRFQNGKIHYREVCRLCGGNARGKSTQVGAKELRKLGVDLDTLPWIPEQSQPEQLENKTEQNDLRDLKPQSDHIEIGDPIYKSLCVDATRNRKTGILEYRGVWYHNRNEAFRVGPLKGVTINQGEFFAIVHALVRMKKESCDWPVYSDSQVARCWVRTRGLDSELIHQMDIDSKTKDLLERATRWLRNNEFTNEVLKWNTAVWGENPADFGRK